MAAGTSPRTWNKVGTATNPAANLVVGASATPFGPSTIVIANTGATNPLYFALTWGSDSTDLVPNVATATDDGISFRVNAGKEYAINFNTQNSKNKLNISIFASADTTYLINAVQAQ